MIKKLRLHQKRRLLLKLPPRKLRNPSRLLLRKTTLQLRRRLKSLPKRPRIRLFPKLLRKRSPRTQMCR